MHLRPLRWKHSINHWTNQGGPSVDVSLLLLMLLSLPFKRMGEIKVSKEGHDLQGKRYPFFLQKGNILSTIFKIFHLPLYSHSPPFPTLSIVLGPAGLSPWVLSPHLSLATRPFLIKCHYTRRLIAPFPQRGRKTGEAVNRLGQSYQKLSAEGMGVYLSLPGEPGIKGCGVGAACQQS